MRKINYPLIISDCDGTLINRQSKVGEKTKKAIAEYIRVGGKFVLSTGRLPAGILSFAKELGLKGIVSCGQGSIILDIESEEILLEGRLSMEATLGVCKKMEEMGLHIHAYDTFNYYSNMDDQALKDYENIVGVKATVVKDKKLSQFLEEQNLQAFKLLAMVDKADCDTIMQTLQGYGFDCAWTRSAKFLVEAVNPVYSKGTAVAFLAEHYGVPLERTVAIGDQCNDISMIERAGVGVAVQNADERLKERADYICACTNEEDAVAEVIEKYGFYEVNGDE